MNDTAENAERGGQRIGFRSRIHHRSSWLERFADRMTRWFGSSSFLVANILLFTIWIIWNLGIISKLTQFDPFPFGFLTMIVSLEAIVLSIAVLISQNKESAIADLREETDFEINVRAEEEITKILNMLDEIHDHLGLAATDDEELAKMKQKTDIAEIEDTIIKSREE